MQHGIAFSFFMGLLGFYMTVVQVVTLFINKCQNSISYLKKELQPIALVNPQVKKKILYRK